MIFQCNLYFTKELLTTQKYKYKLKIRTLERSVL